MKVQEVENKECVVKADKTEVMYSRKFLSGIYFRRFRQSNFLIN